MTVNIQNLFDTKLPEAFDQDPDKAKALDVICQMNISGEDGGEWLINASATGPKVEKGNPGGAQVTLTMSSEDFQKLYEDNNAGMKLYFEGKMRIDGDQMKLMKLNHVMEMTRE